MEQYGWLPPEWTDYGARWGKDNRLYLAEWRRGFEVHQLRALFFECQQVEALKIDRNAALRDLDAATGKIKALEKRIAWYRQQLITQAHVGRMLWEFPPFSDRLHPNRSENGGAG